MMIDIVGIGELLIDFTPAGKSQQNNSLYECNPGGGVPNLLAAASKLGAKCAFIGKVGNDLFGKFLRDELKKMGVDTTGLILSDEYMTTLAFVHLFENGDRDFTFYRKMGADTMITAEEIPFSVINASHALHFSSLTFTTKTATEATLAAVRYAKGKGKLVTYDPNWRPMLWESEEKSKAGMLIGLDYADVVKVSEAELLFLTGAVEEQKGADLLLGKGAKIVLVTKGDKGSAYYCNKGSGNVMPFTVKAIDATGAGDACFGAVIFGILKSEFDVHDIDLSLLHSIVEFANATAALSVTRRGGMPGMPSHKEVEAFIKVAK